MQIIDQLCVAIDVLQNEKAHTLVAIDGMCAAGKSTLAEALASRCHANVFHMDDFFLPAERKTVERLREPGGNVDYERFLDEVLRKVLGGEPVRYRRFNCQTGAFDEAVHIAPRALSIVEGAYSMHPYFGDPYDYTVFLQIDPVLQHERILARNGEAQLRRFVNEWIPLEHAYFDAHRIRERSDLVLGN